MNKVFQKAEIWMNSHARPLEKSLFAFHLRNRSLQNVLEGLKKFQNLDGGFGNAMEPDLRTPYSSVLATSIALQILRSIGIRNNNEIIDDAIKFLLGNYDLKNRSFRIIPKEAENSPHAPWWNQNGEADQFDGFHLNPTAEILGYLFDNKHLVSENILSDLSKKVLETLKLLDKIEMHDFLCCKRLSESNLDPSYKKEVIKELRRLLDSCIEKDSNKWDGYGMRPLQVADSPDSPFIDLLQNEVEKNLDYEIAHQNEDGVWLPTWSWYGNYPNEWEKAKQDWTGVITLEKLIILKKFGRVQ